MRQNDNDDYIKVLPQDIELEAALIGACLLEPKHAINNIEDLVREETFYKEEHKVIFKAILDMWRTRAQIDILTVANYLKKTGKLNFIGGPYYITTMTNRVASAANIRHHAMILVEKQIRRDLILESQQSIENLYNESIDVFQLINDKHKKLDEVSGIISPNRVVNGYDVGKEVIDEIIRQRNTQGLLGVSSGFDEIDAITMGWQKSEMIVIAARPSMGKTAFVLSLAANAVKTYRRHVGIFSLEMSARQLMKRLASMETGIDAQRLRGAKEVTDDELALIGNNIGEFGQYLLIDDGPLSAIAFRAKVRRLISEYQIQFVIIDYLQLMTGSKAYYGNREAEISEISRSIKAVAKEMDIPVIALAQLSRDVEKRGGNKEPKLSDLRESGSIEQDADVVAFIHRPEYYGMTKDAEGKDLTGIAQIMFAKQRNGPLGTAILKYISTLTKFENLNNQQPF